jgi:DNA invertase Pin-like site-specific DNA recombinase
MISKNAGGEQQRPPPNTTRAPSAELRHAKPHEGALIDGIDANIYNDLIKEIGQPARRRKKVNTALAEKMQRAGWSYAQIAKHFRVSACTIRRRLHETKR